MARPRRRGKGQGVRVEVAEDVEQDLGRQGDLGQLAGIGAADLFRALADDPGNRGTFPRARSRKRRPGWRRC